jgi:hypothetical protein
MADGGADASGTGRGWLAAGRIIKRTHRLRLTNPPALRWPTCERQPCCRKSQLNSHPSYCTAPSSRMSTIHDLDTQCQLPSGNCVGGMMRTYARQRVD